MGDWRGAKRCTSVVRIIVYLKLRYGFGIAKRPSIRGRVALQVARIDKTHHIARDISLTIATKE
jgi:hypothetical protein